MADPKILSLASGTGAGSPDYWRQQLDWSADVRQKKLESWRRNTKAYLDQLKPSDPDGIRVPIEFSKTEQKKYQLFYRLPAIKLRPSARTIRSSYPQTPDGQPDFAQAPARDLKKAIAIFREVLTYYVGVKGANTKALMDEIVFDVLCPSGIAFVKLGYERYDNGTVPVQVGWEDVLNVGDVLGLSPSAKVPIYEPAPNIVCEQYYASRISPARGLIPAEFMGSDFNLADFLAHDFFILPETAKKRGWNIDGADIKANDKAAIVQDDRIMPLEQTGRRTGQVRCREVFYYPYRLGLHDNPDKIRRLVFVGDNKTPVVHQDFKDQRFDARGKWIGGLKTHPIKVLTLRYVSDMAVPPSDCQITRSQSDELAEFRTQQMRHKRKAIPRLAVNVDAFPNEDAKNKFLRGEHYGDIPVMGAARLDKVALEISKPTLPPENAYSENQLKRDIDEAWALGGNASGVKEKGSPTATEIAAIAQATANRLGGEREKCVTFWLSLVESIGSLVQMYADREDYVEIVGEDGAKSIEAWDRDTIAGEFLYEVVPDSSLPPDAAADRDLALNAYNLLANDPFINREQLVRDTASAYGLDPDRLVRVPEPPKEEKPKVSVAIKGDDLNPAMPQYANVTNLLIASGVPGDQMAAQPTQPTEDTGPSPSVDRERLRMAESDEADKRGGGLVGTAATVS